MTNPHNEAWPVAGRRRHIGAGLAAFALLTSGCAVRGNYVDDGAINSGRVLHNQKVIVLGGSAVRYDAGIEGDDADGGTNICDTMSHDKSLQNVTLHVPSNDTDWIGFDKTLFSGCGNDRDGVVWISASRLATPLQMNANGSALPLSTSHH